MPHPVSRVVSRFNFFRGAGGDVFWWALPVERSDVSGVRGVSGGKLGCVVGYCCRRSSVLAFFGEQTVRVVACGGYSVSFDAIGSVGRGVGGGAGVFVWVGITRRVQGGLLGLVVTGLSVLLTWGIREGYVLLWG